MKKRPATVRVQLFAVVQEKNGRYLMQQSKGIWEFPMFIELPAGSAHASRLLPPHDHASSPRGPGLHGRSGEPSRVRMAKVQRPPGVVANPKDSSGEAALTPEVLNFAIVGCGGITLQNHLPGLALCPDVKVIALCDTNRRDARNARASRPASTVTSTQLRGDRDARRRSRRHHRHAEFRLTRRSRWPPSRTANTCFARSRSR